MATMARSMKLNPTQWPESLPQYDDDKVFSVICGNTSLKWTIHEGSSMQFTPGCCWRTQLFAEEDLIASPTSTLARHLPQAGLLAIFGQDEDVTKEMAQQASLTRASPLLTVYLISTNDEQAKNVAWCFSEIPSRVYTMRPNDFFTPQQGRYETMGIDRLVSMKATAQIVGYPALVIDGGTCMTYTMCTADGMIRGGGIGLGLHAKFASIARNSQHAAGMSDVAQAAELVELANALATAGKPLNVFSTTTRDAVVSTALREIILHGRSIIKEYLNIIQEEGQAPASETPEEEKTLRFNGQVLKRSNDGPPKVVVTGGDGHLLCKILAPDHCGLVAPDPSIPSYETYSIKHLMAFGISHVLVAKFAEHKNEPRSELDQLLIGCRVAKEFAVPDKDGDRVYRGTITASIRDEKGPEFLVLYDDVDTESLGCVEIHAALTLYSKVGEKFKMPEIVQQVAKKKDQALKAATELESKLEQVKQAASSNRVKAISAAALTSKPITPAATATKPSTAPKPTSAARKPSPAAKRKSSSSAAAPSPKKVKKDPKSFINTRVAKSFDGNMYFGTVTAYDDEEKLFSIAYDDGDEEEFDENDMKKYTKMYAGFGDTDPRRTKK